MAERKVIIEHRLSFGTYMTILLVLCGLAIMVGGVADAIRFTARGPSGPVQCFDYTDGKNGEPC